MLLFCSKPFGWVTFSALTKKGKKRRVRLLLSEKTEWVKHLTSQQQQHQYLCSAAIFVPSSDMETAFHRWDVISEGEFTSDQLLPESADSQMLPRFTTAARLDPSLDDAMPYHWAELPLGLDSLQLTPASLESQMLPPFTTAANLEPSLDEEISYHSWVLLVCLSIPLVVKFLTLVVPFLVYRSNLPV